MNTVEALKTRRKELISIRVRHMQDTRSDKPEDLDYERDGPTFGDSDDMVYYHHLTGAIQELTYLIALFALPSSRVTGKRYANP